MTGIVMPSSQVLLKVFTSCKPFARVSNAVVVWAVERLSGRSDSFLVNFSHMTEQPSTVGETRVLFTSSLIAFIRTFMFVHMLVPFTRPSKDLASAAAILMLTYDLTFFVPRWFSIWPRRICFDGVAGSW